MAKKIAPRGYVAVVSFSKTIKSSFEFKFESDTICIITFWYRDISKLNLHHFIYQVNKQYLNYIRNNNNENGII